MQRRVCLSERGVQLIARALLVACLAACGTEPTIEASATWYGQVGPIVREHCAGCHRSGGIAPFSLYEVGDAQEQMAKMVTAIDSGEMPPFAAIDAPDCTPRHAWRDDPRLSAEESRLLHAWVDQGGPAGPPRAIPDVPSTTLDDPTVAMDPVQSFASSGDRDQFGPRTKLEGIVGSLPDPKKLVIIRAGDFK